MSTFKPEGYNSLSPYFIVDDAEKFIVFLINVFGGTELRNFTREDGSIMHAEVRIDDSVLMLSSATQQYPAYTMILHLYHSDCAAVYKKALEYGCTGYEAPVKKEGDPDMRGTFTDTWGNMWSIGTQATE